MNRTLKKTLKNKNKLKQEGGNNSINVLSWNICWQAMKGEAKGSAPILGAKCAKTEFNRITKLNECSTNVSKLIDSLIIDYDFIAIQEAAKWEAIYKQSKKLKAMGYVHHRIGSSSDLVTFYNKDKYEAKAVVSYTIIHNAKRGRPYHIIYLQHRITLEFYIFINLHNAVGVTKDDLERQLSSRFHKFFEITRTEQKHAEQLKKRIQPRWSMTNYNVIVAGDFNDQGLMNYWQGLYPFKHTNISILKDILVKCEPEPPKTCCRERENTNPPYNGDYILVNSSLAIEKNNYIPKSEHLFPSSDHLPVLIELKSRTAVSAPLTIGVRTRARKKIDLDLKYPEESDEESDEELILEESDEESDDAIIVPRQEEIIVPRQEEKIVPPNAIISPPNAIIVPTQEETGPTGQIEETIQPTQPEARPPAQPPPTQPEARPPAQGTPTQGTPTQGPPTQGAVTRPPIQGPPTQGTPTQGAETRPPAQGTPTQGAETRPPTQGAETRPPTQGPPTQGATQGAETRPPTQGAETRPPTQGAETRPPTQEAVQASIEKKEFARETALETETESSNMFSAPLMAMICAIPVVYLLSK
uniref:Endonuclease/exonuclease/phosphatase domain-containing protein n=1 Tax=viral metagenome TaxID=1070528 RepID=A0A6C0KQX1_9ZZZZ